MIVGLPLMAILAGPTVEIDGARLSASVSGQSADRQISLSLSDAFGGQPLRQAEPLAWLYPDDPALPCPSIISRSMNGALDSPAISLNTVAIVAAFEDGSVGLLDPQTKFAGTQLRAAVDLGAPVRNLSINAAGDRILALTAKGERLMLDSETGLAILSRQALSGASAGAFDGDSAWVFDGRTVSVLDREGITLGHWPLEGKGDPVVKSSSEGGVLIGSRSGPLFHASHRSRNPNPVAGLVGLRDSAYDPASRSWLVVDGQGLLHRLRADGKVNSVSGVGGATSLAIDREGRMALIVTGEGQELALIDLADDQVIDRSPLPEPLDRITASDGFAYVHSQHGALVRLVSFEVVRSQRRISIVDLPVGEGRGVPTPVTNRIGVMPGGAAIIGSDQRTLYAYAEGMMVAMGSFAGITRPLASVAVVDRSLREVQPGLYRTAASVPYGGRYRIPVRLANPKLDTCLTVDLPGPARSVPVKVMASRFDQPDVRSQPSADVPLLLHSRSNARTVIALATDTTGSWQRHFPMSHQGDGRFTGTVRFPKAGLYRVVALDARATVTVGVKP